MLRPEVHPPRNIVLKYAPWRLVAYVLLLSVFVWFGMFLFFVNDYVYAWYLYLGVLIYLLVFITINIFTHRLKAIEIVSNGVIIYGKFLNPLLLEWEDIEDIGTTMPANFGGLQRVIVEMRMDTDKKYLSKVNLLYRLWVWLHLMERDGFSVTTYLMNESAEEVEQLLDDAKTEYFKKKLQANIP